MDPDDIDYIQQRINQVEILGVSPHIVLAPKPRISSLKEYVLPYQANHCIAQSLYNELSGRIIIGTEDSPVTLQHIMSAMGLESSGEPDIGIYGTTPDMVHIYVQEVLPSMTESGIQSVYTYLKGTTNMMGKTMPINAIVGGIMHAFSYFSENVLYTIISKLEHETSPLYMKEKDIRDAYEWYKKQIETHIIPDRVSFYRDALERLNAHAVPDYGITMYPLVKDIQKVIIRPIQSMDVIDTISRAHTSALMPMVVSKVDDRKIIKVNKKLRAKGDELILPPDVTKWFLDARSKDQTLSGHHMNIIIRIGPGTRSNLQPKYQILQYNVRKNYISFNHASRYIDVSEIMTTICSDLNTNALMMPRVQTMTYTFISNHIDLDRHIFAWLITNPPSEYRDMNLHKYVFIKEDSKPSSLRKHITLHMQLGLDKLYITLSHLETTTGTVSPMVPMNDDTVDPNNLIGFISEQPYLLVRINKAPSIHHARIARSIYMHVISMYIKYQMQAKLEIQALTRINVDVSPITSLASLIERPLKVAEMFKYYDRVLYMHISNMDVNILPVPIHRNEASQWRDNGYDVLRLPADVTNDPNITFLTEGEIWVRTSSPGRFHLVLKAETNSYFPILGRAKSTTTIPIEISKDMRITVSALHRTTSYVLNDKKSLATAIGRYASLTPNTLTFLEPILASGDKIVYANQLKRLGISGDIVASLNTAIHGSDYKSRVTLEAIASHASACMQECWGSDVDDVRSDILVRHVMPFKHYRALELAFNINIYFIMDDEIQPVMRKPPHSKFYLHRPANKQWPTLILHSIRRDPNTVSLIVLPESKRTTNPYQCLFGGHDYLDARSTSTISMTSPELGMTTILKTVIPKMIFNNYAGIPILKAIEQVIDQHGKTRGITYAYKDGYITIDIGFSSPVDLPIGMPRGGDRMLEDLKKQRIFMSKEDHAWLDSATVIPESVPGVFDRWKVMEKHARILQVLTLLLYSVSALDADRFIEIHTIVEPSTYNMDGLPNALPNIKGSEDDAWRYFGSVIPSMVDEEVRKIILPDVGMQVALARYLMASGKILWPSMFPLYVKYEWDIDRDDDEKVFLSDIDAIHHLAKRTIPTESHEIVTSDFPYVLDRDGYIYLVQMASTIEYAKYIAYMWVNESINPARVLDDRMSIAEDYPLPMISYNFHDRISDISMTQKDGHIFVIIPL